MNILILSYDEMFDEVTPMTTKLAAALDRIAAQDGLYSLLDARRAWLVAKIEEYNEFTATDGRG